jgi:hypothetical protein
VYSRNGSRAYLTAQDKSTVSDLSCLSILDRPPQFDMSVQARIPASLAAVHNFIRKHDPQEIHNFSDILDDIPDEEEFGELADGPSSRAERLQAQEDQEEIAQSMWEDYSAYVAAHDL